jgi:RimJ/RimL family protein N-acetyltransferase
VTEAAWFPEVLEGSLVVLRRHIPENVAAFQRWYSDPEVARLARYQDAPMRADEIDRFFQLRALGHESLTMAIHERAGDRLIGSCAFSQVDGENGSAMFHITIGEKDAWGRGYGTEATQLMLDHAFGTLGLHRIALTVFEFNERAIRAYRRCGFLVEGRARESIWRDGRWWDEVAMSVLASEWRERRGAADRAGRSSAEAGSVVGTRGWSGGEGVAARGGSAGPREAARGDGPGGERLATRADGPGGERLAASADERSGSVVR